MSESTINVYIGNIIHCNKEYTVEVLKESFIGVQQNKIIVIDKTSELKKFEKNHENNKMNEVVLTDYQILIPGLIDTHIHASQYPFLGLGLNKPLEKWLEEHIYPLEGKFSDVNFARKCYEAVVKKTLSYGTTTANYCGARHTDPSIILADIAIKYGQRAFIGRVNATAVSPYIYTESSLLTVEETKRFVKAVLDKKNPLVQPTIHPAHMFRISIDDAKNLSNLAKEYNLRIHTHMCEIEGEPERAQKIYGKSYGEVLIENGILTDKTIVAHAVHIPEEETRQLAKYKTSVAHCPSSNFNLLSGICDVKALISAGVSVGLGSDISAGTHVGIADQMRNAMTASNAISFHRKNYKPIAFSDAFYMATLGGAKALSIDDVVGNFEVGKDFDALVVDMNVKNGNSDCLLEHDPFELLQKFIYVGDDRNVVSAFVAGKQVKNNFC